MKINNIKHSFDSKIFEDELDFKTLENLLETLDHIEPKKISRQEFDELEWNFLVETWEDKFWNHYNLFLPEDLVYWELLYFIDFLTNKFNLQNYIPFEKIFSQVKIMLVIILRQDWRIEELKYLQKKYNLSDELLNKLLSQNLKYSHSKNFINLVKLKRESNWQNVDVWKDKEDLEICFNELKGLFWQEFDLTFFRKWVNMLSLWMMTITQTEQEKLIEENEWSECFITRVDFKKLDVKKKLLREKIGMDEFKQELEKARKSENQELINKLELEVANKILNVLKNYPYIVNEQNYWYKINKILKYKEIYCVWFSLIWYAFLKELEIKNNWLDITKHSALELIIWWKKYFFDPTITSNELLEFEYWKKVWAYNEVDLYSIGVVKLLIQSWNSEKILLSQIYNNKWNSLKESWRIEEAIKMCDKAIELNPNYSDIYTNKWNCLNELWKFEEAISSYDKAIELNPNFFLIYNNKWNSLHNLWKYEEAIKMYDEAIKLKYDIYYIYRNKWNSLCNLWKYEEAIKIYDMSLLFEPNDSIVYNSKWGLFNKIWKTKEWKLNLYTSKLLKWVKVNYEEEYQEQKQQIKWLIEDENYEWLRKYLNNIENPIAWIEAVRVIL